MTARHYSKTQNSIISFEYVDSEAKIFLILYTPVENYTTRIAIMQGNMTTIIFKHFSVSILIQNIDKKKPGLKKMMIFLA